MKNKKGFTLVELLAVIVILAVIAIIAIPIITNVIDKAKQGALKDSAYGILDSAEMYLAKNMNKGIEDTMEFTCNNGKCLSGTEEIDYKGKIESGKVRIYTDSKIELCVTDNKSSALKTVANKKVEVATGTCDYGELNYGVTALVSKEALDAKQRELDEANEKYDNLKALADQTDITAEDIKVGKKALVNGKIITGIATGSKNIIYLGTNNSYNIASLYPDIYESLTASNFILSYSGFSQSISCVMTETHDGNPTVRGTSFVTPSLSYSNGVVSKINGSVGVQYQFYNYPSDNVTKITNCGAVNASYGIYLVY